MPTHILDHAFHILYEYFLCFLLVGNLINLLCFLLVGYYDFLAEMHNMCMIHHEGRWVFHAYSWCSRQLLHNSNAIKIEMKWGEASIIRKFAMKLVSSRKFQYQSEANLVSYRSEMNGNSQRMSQYRSKANRVSSKLRKDSDVKFTKISQYVEGTNLFSPKICKIELKRTTNRRERERESWRAREERVIRGIRYSNVFGCCLGYRQGTECLNPIQKAHFQTVLDMSLNFHLDLLVHYHCGGWPEEVNSCVLNSYMVYL
jgi:hypothetical protein